MSSSSSGRIGGKVASVVKEMTKQQPQQQAQAVSPKWSAVHAQALADGKNSYTDPTTGYLCFTEIEHLKRGYCCGNKCRHCPYEYKNVGKSPAEIAVDREAAKWKRK
ncbi:hypothetical protein BJ742DRAFT_798637 [Cladochytrium replicatum]|nr:hypothetical protein BJ742DRAFT_798637 [Cladochytrium replicatum]